MYGSLCFLFFCLAIYHVYCTVEVRTGHSSNESLWSIHAGILTMKFKMQVNSIVYCISQSGSNICAYLTVVGHCCVHCICPCIKYRLLVQNDHEISRPLHCLWNEGVSGPSWVYSPGVSVSVIVALLEPPLDVYHLPPLTSTNPWCSCQKPAVSVWPILPHTFHKATLKPYTTTLLILQSF